MFDMSIFSVSGLSMIELTMVRRRREKMPILEEVFKVVAQCWYIMK
jgi:vacuolar-type H+-ATPase subunit B/Vma2